MPIRFWFGQTQARSGWGHSIGTFQFIGIRILELKWINYMKHGFISFFWKLCMHVTYDPTRVVTTSAGRYILLIRNSSQISVLLPLVVVAAWTPHRLHHLHLEEWPYL